MTVDGGVALCYAVLRGHRAYCGPVSDVMVCVTCAGCIQR
jgi:hypothetical protein